MSTTETLPADLRMRASRNPNEHGYDQTDSIEHWYGTCNLTIDGRTVCFHTWGTSEAEVIADLADGAGDLGATAEQITLATTSPTSGKLAA